jgi:hypothetical protein
VEQNVLEQLRSELNFMGEVECRSPSSRIAVRESIFRSSPICPNFGNPDRPHPCAQCPLMGFVPIDRQSENLPCHHIPLNESGETVATIEAGNERERLSQAVTDWLQFVIKRLERERADNTGLSALLLHICDEPLEALRPVLENLAVRTFRARSCREASQFIERRNPVRLLFVDPILPDGTWASMLDLAARVRPRPSVIIVSREFDKKLTMDVVERGACDVLVPPITVFDLAYIVRCAAWPSCPPVRARVCAA